MNRAFERRAHAHPHRREPRHRPRDRQALLERRLARHHLFAARFPENCPWAAGPEDHIQVDLSDPEDTLARRRGDARTPRWRQAACAGQQRRHLAEGTEGRAARHADDGDESLAPSVRSELFATIGLARGLIEELTRAKGAIVNVTSIAGSRVHPFAGALTRRPRPRSAALTREMAADFGPLGVRVNAIAPAKSTPRSFRPERKRSSRQSRCAGWACPRKSPRRSIICVRINRATSPAPNCTSTAASTFSPIGTMREILDEMGRRAHAGRIGSRSGAVRELSVRPIFVVFYLEKRPAAAYDWTKD